MNQINWLALVTSVSGQNGTLRVRLWRQMKAIGAAALRDGVYLLPARPELRQALANLRDELLAADGMAHVLQVVEDSPATQAEWQALFDRSEAYQQWSEELAALLAQLPESESEARRSLRQLRKELETIATIDFFAGESLESARRQCNDAERQLTRHYSPDEPLAVGGDIPRLNPAGYQKRLWATRARPWVDRVASAWLIRRFIDPAARFIWLTDVYACPVEALGFDFDGATFSHIGERVTFEVLLASFGFEHDPALARLGELVHALDVGGSVVPEGVGFEAVLGGARSRIADDDLLLADISNVLDSLYTHFQGAARP
ncbi:chromate resistance protein ChrB domain-containing protein [Pseudogulbenkiania ferrooxidans]|uniref:Chromate resistance signal peptide protein n=1 Tax=Pseudogulbenkiania ferrooxidans 2002 TaxID=279714 RepID=B9Z0R9_9NEIS|nr:chromate resistance protein ChrB domain-containing protein [Pseudogulbenkiania ferrooxidans]EEG09675.1 chromate resistance signal peptide protein [Pseudogulbenkiania ferrooxidans 2002]